MTFNVKFDENYRQIHFLHNTHDESVIFTAIKNYLGLKFKHHYVGGGGWRCESYDAIRLCVSTWCYVNVDLWEYLKLTIMFANIWVSVFISDFIRD